jgi:hypothetical protein
MTTPHDPLLDDKAAPLIALCGVFSAIAAARMTVRTRQTVEPSGLLLNSELTLRLTAHGYPELGDYKGRHPKPITRTVLSKCTHCVVPNDAYSITSHDREKSHSAIGAAKPTSKADATSVADAAEPMEPRAGTKRNASEQSTHRTQRWVRVTKLPHCNMAAMVDNGLHGTGCANANGNLIGRVRVRTNLAASPMTTAMCQEETKSTSSRPLHSRHFDARGDWATPLLYGPARERLAMVGSNASSTGTRARAFF